MQPRQPAQRANFSSTSGIAATTAGATSPIGARPMQPCRKSATHRARAVQRKHMHASTALSRQPHERGARLPDCTLAVTVRSRDHRTPVFSLSWTASTAAACSQHAHEWPAVKCARGDGRGWYAPRRCGGVFCAACSGNSRALAGRRDAAHPATVIYNVHSQLCSRQRMCVCATWRRRRRRRRQAVHA